MARFGLSPYSDPVESALKSFGSGLQDISLLKQLTSGNQEREAQQHRQLMDLNIQNAQQRNQEYQDDSENRALDRQTKNNDLHTKIAKQTYGPGIEEAMQTLKQGPGPDGKPLPLSANAIASVLGFADEHSHFGGTKNDEADHVQQAVAANKVQQRLIQIGPVLQQHTQQTGQTAHRIDNTNAPGFIDDINAAFKGSSLFDGKEVQALGVDTKTGEVSVLVKGKEGPEILKDDKGQPKKFTVPDLQNMANKSASFGNLVLSAYGQLNGNDANMKEVETQKKQIAATHGRLATLDEYADWETKNPDATVAQKRTQIQKIGAKNNVDETTLDKIAKEQIQEKTVNNPRSALAGKETIVDGKRVYLDNDGNPTGVIVPPKDRAPVDPVVEEMRQQRLDDAKDKRQREIKEDHAKLVKEKAAIIQRTDDGKTMSDDEIQEEAERLAKAQESGSKPGKSGRKIESERLKPLKDDFSNISEGFMGLRATDTSYKIESAIKKGWSRDEIKKAAKGTPMEAAVNEYDFSKSTGKKSRELPEMNSMPAASSYNGKIIRDNQTGKRYKSDGKKWNEIA